MRPTRPPLNGDSRPNRRKREAKKPKRSLFRFFYSLLMLLCALLLAAAVVLLVQVLSQSDYFRVEQIEVEGCQRLDAETVIALSDIRQGMRTFDVDLDRVGRRLQESDWIGRAEVTRILPRRLVIRIVERQPVFILNLDYLYYVDDDGVIFRALHQGDPLDLPLAAGLSREQLLQQREASQDLLRQTAALVLELRARKRFTLAQVAQIRIDPASGLELYTQPAAVAVRLGRDDHAGKLDRLEQIYSRLQPQLESLSYIDLNVPDKVIVKQRHW